MLEDTLQTVRTTYRLIIAISALTLVFALTIDYPVKKQAQVEQIQALLAFDFSDYHSFAKQRVELFNEQEIHPLAKRIEDKIEARDYQFLLLDDLYKPLYHPPEVYSFKALEYIENKKELLSYKSLQQIKGAWLKQDIQVAVPDLLALESALLRILERHKSLTGLSIRNAGYLTSYVDNPPHFEQELGYQQAFTFQLELPAGPTPVFKPVVDTKVITIPNSSFYDWLEKQDRKFFRQVKWLPSLKDLSAEFQQRSLSTLLIDLKREIESTSPKNLKVAFLGAEIPGLLFVYVSPVLIVVFMYHLNSLLRHLSVLSVKECNQADIASFAWLPLLNTNIWKVEFSVMTYVLPLASLIAMLVKLSPFEDSFLVPLYGYSLAAIACTYLQTTSHKYLFDIRTCIH